MYGNRMKAHTLAQRRLMHRKGLRKSLIFTPGFSVKVFPHKETVSKDWVGWLSFKMPNFQLKVIGHTKK